MSINARHGANIHNGVEASGKRARICFVTYRYRGNTGIYAKDGHPGIESAKRKRGIAKQRQGPHQQQ
jgi:hypothetical protein